MPRKPSQPPVTELLLEAEDLSLIQDGQKLLQHIHLRLHRGELISLIGPNGSGKTTLLHLLLGITRPSAGRVTQKTGIRLGYVPQRVRVDPHLPITVADFLRLGRPAPTHQPTLDERAILHELGLCTLENQMIHRLSGGEWQRALLARAALRQPDVLILDEPAQGVDVEGEMALYAFIEKLRKQLNCGVLMVSHDLHWVMSSSSWVICLNQHICCEGKPSHVRGHGAFQNLFPREHRLMAPYQHHHDHRHDWQHDEHQHG